MRGWLPSLLACLLLAGCLSAGREQPRPARTSFASRLAVVPARTLGNMFIVEAKWDRYGPYHFLVDTGSSVTLVSSELAQRYRAGGRPPPQAPQVRVRSAGGAVTVLPAAVLGRLELGAARFYDVPVLVYDCGDITGQLGLKIDGVLGFPLFRDTVFTLDYPRGRLVLRPRQAYAAPLPGSTLEFDDAEKIPLIPVRLGRRTLVALVDSGSDAVLSLNPVGLAPKFSFGPAEGPTLGTLTGNRIEPVGRLAETLSIGDYAVPSPVAEVTQELSALGGGTLKHFAVTFDPEHDRVTFYRDSEDPIEVPGLYGPGLSFGKTPAYWKVVGVVPGSPAAAAGVEPGDLVTRIDGEPVAKWDLPRYERMLSGAKEVAFTFLDGAGEIEKRMPVVALVP